PEGRELLRLFDTSAWAVIAKEFKDPRTQVHLLRLTTEFMMLPESPGTAFALMLMAGLYHSYNCGIAIGGSQSFADALVRCIRHHGGVVETGVEVSRIETQGGRATAVITASGERINAKQAVIAGIPPWKLNHFVDGVDELARRADQVPASDYTCFLSHLALAEAPKPICAPEHHNMCFTIVAERDPQKVLQMARDVTANRLPQGFSSAYVCASNQDPSRAPPGKATLYLYHLAPKTLAGKGANGWDEIKDEFGQWLISNTRRYVPNLTPDNILGVSHCSPLDIARESASYKFGDVAGLATTPEMLIHGRPLPELAQFRVPGVDGLYLCGPFMHPGGGATGGGRAVAMRVLLDRGMDLKSAFVY
ncbi:MAG TPA: NAD(P)/FAD-dependent oxidoreductase, partial [Macromonas sp.]|nr:NAD(P)/FAD-dependent oxidoreductase [Macromonas sp.]